MSGYSTEIKDGREIYIPSWAVNVQLENLTQASKVLGASNVINISEPNVASVTYAIMNAEDAKLTAKLIKHFVCHVRIEGDKITEENIDSYFEGQLSTVIELFAHVIHSQYADFFDSGLAKEASQKG